MRRCLMSSASAGTAEPQTLTATAGTIISKHRGADIAFNEDTVPLAEPVKKCFCWGSTFCLGGSIADKNVTSASWRWCAFHTVSSLPVMDDVSKHISASNAGKLKIQGRILS